MSSVASASDVFRAVADPTRRSMLDLLRDRDRSAGELATPFDMTRPAVSQHLRVLLEAGLIRGRQDGRRRVYRINGRPFRALCVWASRYQELVDPAGHIWRITRPPRTVTNHETEPRSHRSRSDDRKTSPWLEGMLAALGAQPAAAQARAQGSRELALPGAEHKRLELLVGDWKIDAEFRLSPARAWEKTMGQASYRTVLGGRFVTEEASIDLRGNKFEWMGIYGYDRRALKYTAVWMDSGDTGIERAEGSIDQSGTTIVLGGERASSDSAPTPFKWVMSFDSPSQITIEMRLGQPGGGAEFANLRMTARRQPSQADLYT